MGFPEVLRLLPEVGKTSSAKSHVQDSKASAKTDTKSQTPEYKLQPVWTSVMFFSYVHIGSIYGLYLLFTQAKLATVAWFLLVCWYTAMGITAGVHRLWAHKCYKAKLPLRIFLAFCNASAFQYSIYQWARDHRVHHKFTDTDADPYNSKRGFFFSQIGWLLVRKHKDVGLKGKAIDMSDLEKDPVVMWQKRLYYPLLMPLCTFVLPFFVPWYFWGESATVAWYVPVVLRYVLILNDSGLVNSAAHLWGMKPYDRSVSPAENLYVGILAFGEGWHNYHHAFPWDYKTSEHSGYKTNLTSAFIDFFAKVGWAYDLKTADPEMIVKRANRTGDGSHPEHKVSEFPDSLARIINPKKSH